MENLFSLLSYIHQVPTMSLILIFVAGFGLGGLIVDSYYSYKHNKLRAEITPRVKQLQDNLRRMRELNDKYRFMELQRSMDSASIEKAVREAMESDDSE